VILAPEKRRLGSANIVGIESILRAIRLRFRNLFCYVGSSHYSYLCFILGTYGRAQYRSYSSLITLSSLSPSHLKNAFGVFVFIGGGALVGGGEGAASVSLYLVS
jgi:hypothetical protein